MYGIGSSGIGINVNDASSSANSTVALARRLGETVSTLTDTVKGAYNIIHTLDGQIETLYELDSMDARIAGLKQQLAEAHKKEREKHRRDSSVKGYDGSNGTGYVPTDSLCETVFQVYDKLPDDGKKARLQTVAEIVVDITKKRIKQICDEAEHEELVPIYNARCDEYLDHLSHAASHKGHLNNGNNKRRRKKRK